MSDHQKLEEARRLFNLGVAAGLELRWAIAKEHFLQAVMDYQSRERRFGKTSEQLIPKGKGASEE
jgi:hypothetical protein